MTTVAHLLHLNPHKTFKLSVLNDIVNPMKVVTKRDNIFPAKYSKHVILKDQSVVTYLERTVLAISYKVLDKKPIEERLREKVERMRVGLGLKIDRNDSASVFQVNPEESCRIEVVSSVRENLKKSDLS